VLGSVGGILTLRRRYLGALVIVLAAIVGGVAINLFSINTFDVLAVPLWLIAAILAATASST
jgi:hypothetical protein